MKRTLLDMTQEILSEMDSDEVNSIDDTVESQQVANIIRSCYLGIMSNRNWDHMKRLGQLDSSTDHTKPNYLKVPEDMQEMIWLRYNCTKVNDTAIVYRDLLYKYPDEFMRLTQNRNTNDSNTQVVTDFSGVQLFIRSDYAPTYWTAFDDTYIVTDAYDSAVDTTLQSSKTQSYAVYQPQWTHTDLAVPNLPSEAFTGLVEEAKSTAMLKLKQTADAKAEQKATKQRTWLARKQWTTHGGVRYDNYGRKSRK